MVTKVYGTQGVDKVQDNVIATADLQDNAVTAAKIASGVAGTGPAFSAYTSSTTSVSSGVITKVTLNAEYFDTNNNFDTANSKFTPTVAGYYQINANFLMGANANLFNVILIYKNGSIAYVGTQVQNSTSQSSNAVSCILQCNGTTDYIELYAYQTSGSTLSVQTNGGYTGLSGALIRSN